MTTERSLNYSVNQCFNQTLFFLCFPINILVTLHVVDHF